MNGAPLRVLLVDTDTATIARIRSLLCDGRPPCDLTVAETIEGGIGLLLDATFDLAVIAWSTDTISAGDLVQNARLAGLATPIIILTDGCDADLEESIIAAGADDYLCREEITERLLMRAIRYATGRVRHRSNATPQSPRQEDLYRLLIENAIDVITLLEPDGTIRYCSPSVGLVLGYPPDELVGRSMEHLLHPDDHEAVGRLFSDILTRPGSLQRIIFRLKHADGTWVWLETIGRNFIDDPVVRGLVINSRDVTRRRRLEEERDELLTRVRVERERLEALVKGMPGAVWERRGGSDPFSHRITFMSDYIETMIGYTAEEFLELKGAWFDRVHPEDQELVRATIAGHKPPGTYHFNYRIQARDGHLVWVKSNVVSSIADDGEIVERGISLDITEQRHAEEALAESEQRFRVALKASSMAVFSQDRDLRYIWAYNTTLTPSEKMVGLRDSDLFDEQMAEELTRIKQKALDTDLTQHEELILEIDGVVRCFDMVIDPLHDHTGEITGITGASFEVTPFRNAQEEARRNQSLFQTFMDNTPALACIKDSQKRYLFANNQLAALLQMPVDKVVGRTNRELVPPEDAEQYDRSDDKVLQSGQTVTSIETFGPAESRRFWYSVRFPVRTSETDLMVGAVILEITDRIRTEESLRISEERFQLATRATSDVIWDWDLHTREQWMSDNLEVVFGYNAEDVSKDVDWWYSRVDPKQRESVSNGMYDMIDNGGHFWSAEYRFRRADGTYADVLDRAYILHDDGGKPIRMIGAMIDISVVKQAEEALRESQSRLQALFEHAQDTILLVDDDGRYVDVNPAACQLTGYTREELIGRSIQDLVDPEESALAAAGWKLLIEAGEQQGSYSLERKDGSVIDIEYRAVANIIPGLHLSIVRDITERITAERMLKEANDDLEHRVEERTAEIVQMMKKLEQANQTQKRFIADASHDLRTPLTVLRAELDLMHRETTDPDLLYSLRKLIHEASRLDTLINDLLVLTTLEGDKSGRVQRPVRIDELMLESASQLNHLASRKGISWRITTDDVCELSCDESSIKRLLTNLMENAVKYSREHGVVEVSLVKGSAKRSSRESVEIVVRDNGIGIAADDLPHVFDRFYRADTTRSTPGTGLGLAIVKAAAEAHGGTVEVESKLDIGTTVRVCLPVDGKEE